MKHTTTSIFFTRAALCLMFSLGLLLGPTLGQAAKVEPTLSQLLGQAAAYQAKGRIKF